MSKVILAGGSGFVGRHVGRHLKAAGHEVVVLSRSGSGGEFRGVKWDGKSVGDWAKELEGATAVMNFSGAPIDKKWSEEYKRTLRSSRVDPTLAIGEAISKGEAPPAVWVNASAVGFYGDAGDRSLSEASPAGEGFMPELALAWEEATEAFATPKTRKVLGRFGVVLGKDGGALPILEKLTTAFLGGAVGSGKQYMSWIHVDDLARMLVWSLTSEVSGALNVVSPDPRPNAAFMAAMREQIGRPPVPPVPAFALRLTTGLMGMEGEVLLQGQRVYPVNAEANGFRFDYPTLESALGNLISSTPEAWVSSPDGN